MKRQEYLVRTTFNYPGRYFVLATTVEEAQKLVKEHCWKYPARVRITQPYQDDNNSELVGWDFSHTLGGKKIIGEVAVSNRNLPGMLRADGTKKRSKKKCYAVEVVFSRWGAFYVYATSKDKAREFVEKHGQQRNPVYRSTLPPDEVAWEFPRKNITKIIGEITEIEGE